MSRITKEEIEKTKCGRFLLSDENIYLSIYSLNSYVFEYNLLNTEDRILYHRLQDKFDARLINGVITRVREQIIELFDEDKYIEAKVYFKPKKLSENGELEFRPLHSTGLITQIAIVSMLHLFVYEIPEEEEGDPKLRLSNLSRLIPSDFYGNRVSVKPEYLFKPWKQQYQKYNQNSNDALMKYHTSLEYKYEVTLDLENFFPTINPIIIYRYIINHLPAYLNDEEREMMKRVLQKLLFCKLTTTFDEKTARQNIEGVLVPQTITEKLILEIPVDISQMSTIECENPCRKVQIGNISRQEITLICGEGCQNKSNEGLENRCNFLCRWFCVKNDYLIKELVALKEYLNRNKNNYFKCEIEIKIKCNNKTSIEARQFEILNHYIQDRK